MFVPGVIGVPNLVEHAQGFKVPPGLALNYRPTLLTSFNKMPTLFYCSKLRAYIVNNAGQGT
jgi:hypothetical protein